MQKDLLNDALRHAIDGHFCKLFGVFMADPSPASLERFRAGIDQLVKAERVVAEVIREGDIA